MAVVRVILIAVFFCTLPLSIASADGLYRGHGYRSHDFDWDWRLNLSGGIHGAEDPWQGLPGEKRYPVGGAGEVGFEVSLGGDTSLELYGAIRSLDETEDFVVLNPGQLTGRPGRYRYEIDALAGGLTFRGYHVRAGRGFHWGIGVGVVQADASYEEVVAAGERFAAAGSATGPEAHILFGMDGAPSPRLRLALEVGIRATFLDYENELGPGTDAGDFTGAYVLARCSFAAKR